MWGIRNDSRVYVKERQRGKNDQKAAYYKMSQNIPDCFKDYFKSHGRNTKLPVVDSMKYLIEQIINEIPDVKNNRWNYKIELGYIVTNFDQVQHPHLDMRSNRYPEKVEWIVHFPLSRKGEYFYIYTGDWMGNYTLLHIPLGLFLVLRSDVYHGGFGGGKGNVWMYITFEPKIMSSMTGKLKLADTPFNPEEHMKNREARYDTNKIFEMCDKSITKMLDGYPDILEKDFRFQITTLIILHNLSIFI